MRFDDFLDAYYSIIGWATITGILLITWTYTRDPQALLQVDTELVVLMASIGGLGTVWSMYRWNKIQQRLDELEKKVEESGNRD